jgi:hypothetical protein
VRFTENKTCQWDLRGAAGSADRVSARFPGSSPMPCMSQILIVSQGPKRQQGACQIRARCWANAPRTPEGWGGGVGPRCPPGGPCRTTRERAKTREPRAALRCCGSISERRCLVLSGTKHSRYSGCPGPPQRLPTHQGTGAIASRAQLLFAAHMAPVF